MSASAEHTAHRIYKASKKLARKYQRNGDQLKAYADSELRALLNDVEELVERVGNIADADISRLRSKITETVASVRQIAQDSAQSISERARSAASATDDYVRERPWTTIGAAAALALLVGVGLKAAATRR
jgi:ElaB/YqjD/DUF883 family membrane-anchored ribosome-binding protein